MKPAIVRLSEMEPKFSSYLGDILERIQSTYPDAVYDGVSADKHISFKLQMTENLQRLFITFDPRKDYILTEIFVNIDKLKDRMKLCTRPERKDIRDKISLLKLTLETDEEYLFELIEQSYQNVL